MENESVNNEIQKKEEPHLVSEFTDFRKDYNKNTKWDKRHKLLALMVAILIPTIAALLSSNAIESWIADNLSATTTGILKNAPIDSIYNKNEGVIPNNESIASSDIVQVYDEATLIAAIANADNSTVIELIQDIQLNSMLVIPENVSITLTSVTGNMHSLTVSGNFDVIMVENGATLVVDGIMISRLPDTKGRGIHNWGELFMESGLITDHINPNTGILGLGGGVLNDTGANFHMLGGTISNNETSGEGGGVYNQGRFLMSGGEINNNSAGVSGGGVYNHNGTFTLYNGTIRDNSAENGGGGLFNLGGVFVMLDGNITNNTAANWGGGINNWGEVTIRGGEISSNNANVGGGISNNGEGTQLNIENGNITRNRAEWGGGVINRTGTFNMQNGSISHNEARSSGGGVFNDGFRHENAEYVHVGVFNMSGGNISHNTANFFGGGVRNGIYGLFTMLGGSISYNNSNDGGGVGSEWVFYMHGGSITQNTSRIGAGGVSLYGEYVDFHHVHGDISNNRPINLYP